MNVDGLKTGHTSGAGFNLIASAVDGQRRLIAVVMGAESAKGREDQARKLLQWGQQNFDTVQVLRSGKQVGIERIWYGDKEKISLGTEQDFWMAPLLPINVWGKLNSTIGINWWRTGLWLRWSLSTKVVSSRV